MFSLFFYLKSIVINISWKTGSLENIDPRWKLYQKLTQNKRLQFLFFLLIFPSTLWNRISSNKTKPFKGSFSEGGSFWLKSLPSPQILRKINLISIKFYAVVNTLFKVGWRWKKLMSSVKCWLHQILCNKEIQKIADNE